jgi:endonuclease YncB( thermonuclease family)
MIDIVADSQLTCVLTGEKMHRRDVGYCTTADGVDINRAIIEQGAALACPRYDARYFPLGLEGIVSKRTDAPLARRPTKVTVLALANKIARMARASSA